MRGSTRIGGLFSTVTAILVLQLLSCSGSDAVGPPLSAHSALRVHLTASGINLADFSMISLDGADPLRLARNAELLFESIPSGTHAVTISGFVENCSVDGPNPVVVDARPNEMATAEFHLNCTAANGVIEVAVSSSGSWSPLSFGVEVNTGPVLRIRPNSRTYIGSFVPGAYVVSLVGILPSCTIVSDASASVSIAKGSLKQDTVLVNFEVSCASQPESQDEGWQIAFQRGDYVTLVHEDGSGTHLLTPGLAPSWSPDGKYLAYAGQGCDWGCAAGISMISPDGSDAGAITSNDSFLDLDPALSPDGRSITFVRIWLGPDQSYLMVSDLAGTDARVLSIWDPFSTPTWSPDGTQIAFTCEGPGPTWALDICVVKTEGGCKSYFVNECGQLSGLVHLTSSRFVESDPAWSPDGTRIAFTLACYDDSTCPPHVAPSQPYIALLDPLTGSITPMVAGHTPAWSPDGSHLVFAGNVSSPGLKVISLDGTGLRSLTNDPTDTAPSWR